MDGTLRSGRLTAAKKNGRLAKIILGILAVLIVGGAAWFFLAKTGLVQSQVSAGQAVSTTTVKRGNISLTASGSGTLVASQSVNMSFSASGKVAVLNVKLGDTVKKGDVLAKLANAADLEANLASAQANLLNAQQALTKLQKSGSSTLAGAYQDLVTAQNTYTDAAYADLQTTSVRCLPALVSKYKSELDQATYDLKEWSEKNPGSEEWTNAKFNYDTAMANYNYCKGYTATEKTSAQSNLAVAKTTLQQAEEKYKTLKAASGIDPDELSRAEIKVQSSKTLVETAQTALDGITLTASIDGKITTLAASADAIVDTSTFLTISDVSHPTVTVSLDETEVNKLVVGNSAMVTFSALPGQTFSGKVSVANPQMQTFGPFKAATGQVELDAAESKTIQTQPLGLSATITITGKEAKNVLVVPLAAVQSQKNGKYTVGLVDSAGKLTEQAVTVGIQDKTHAEITSGLKEGDVIRIPTTKSSSTSTNSQSGGQFMDGGNMPPAP